MLVSVKNGPMKYLKSLYFWIVLSFVIGCWLGVAYPNLAVKMEPFGTQFIKLIRIFIGPIVFLTVATGIVETGSASKLGRIGIKSFLYFEVMSTFALAVGWLIALVLKPGTHMRVRAQDLDSLSVNHLTHAQKGTHSLTGFLTDLIPNSILSPFVEGHVIQILFLAVLFGVSLLVIGPERNKGVVDVLKTLMACVFTIIRGIMVLSPLGVFGAIAFTMAKVSTAGFVHLFFLMGSFYICSALFVVLILGAITYAMGFTIFSLLRYLLPELLLTLSTASSEPAMPQLFEKLKRLGCRSETVGVVLPLGYTMNLDGTYIYLTLVAFFIAQALGVDMSLTDQLFLFLTAMFVSKGSAAVYGSKFIILVTIISMTPSIPVAGVMLVLGIDRFMAEACALVNIIGNALATIVISIWEGEFSRSQIAGRLKLCHMSATSSFGEKISLTT